MYKRKCKNCIKRDQCQNEQFYPGIGECSFDRSVNTQDEKTVLLKEIGKRLQKGPVTVTRPFTIMRDEIGGEIPFTVRRISPAPGANAERTAFSLGKDEGGEEVTTDGLSAKELKKIINKIS